MTPARQMTYWSAAFVVLLALLFLLGDVLLPFVAGMAIAYFLDPAADKCEQWGLPRWAAATVLTVVFLLAVVVIFILLVPLLQSQIVNLVQRLPQYLEALRGHLNMLLALVQANLSPEDMEKIRGAVSGFAGDTVAWLGKLIGRVWQGGLAILNLLSLLLITPIVTFYLLRDWDKIIARIDELLPRRQAPVIREQAREIDRTLAAFARGQAMVCAGLGVYYGVALSVVGLEFGLVIGFGAGLISFVPYFGMIVGLSASMAMAFAQFSDWISIGLVAGIFILGQIVEGNFVTPKLVGDRVGLHPVWMIFALLAGGALFGFVGVLLSVPVAATIGVLTRFGVGQYLQSPLYGPPMTPFADPSAAREKAPAKDADAAPE